MTDRDENLKQATDSAGHTRSLLRVSQIRSPYSSEGVAGGDWEQQPGSIALKSVLEALNANKGPQEGPVALSLDLDIFI